jgi:ParB-like chromosome segregation protein Spo0J
MSNRRPGMNNAVTRVAQVPLADVQQHPDNPNNGDIEQIAESLQRFGQYRPIVVQESTGWILAGNHTYAAALSLGWTQIQAAYVDVDEPTATRILLADNRIAELALRDNGELLSVLQSLDGDLTGTGYSDKDLDDLVNLLAPPDLDDLAGDLGDMGDDDTAVRVTFRVQPDVAREWDGLVKETGLADPNEAAAAVILRAAGVNG